jgi:hypothetical protein
MNKMKGARIMKETIKMDMKEMKETHETKKMKEISAKKQKRSTWKKLLTDMFDPIEAIERKGLIE